MNKKIRFSGKLVSIGEAQDDGACRLLIENDKGSYYGPTHFSSNRTIIPKIGSTMTIDALLQKSEDGWHEYVNGKENA